MQSNPTRRRRCAAAVVLLGLLFALSGCAQFDFGTYASYEDWMVARQDPFDIESIGVDAEKHGAVDYMLNDCLIRTPVFAAYDASRCVLTVITLPYYVLGGGCEEERATARDYPTGLEAEATR